MKTRQRWIGLVICMLLIVSLWAAASLRMTQASLRDTRDGQIAFICVRSCDRDPIH